MECGICCWEDPAQWKQSKILPVLRKKGWTNMLAHYQFKKPKSWINKRYFSCIPGSSVWKSTPFVLSNGSTVPASHKSSLFLALPNISSLQPPSLIHLRCHCWGFILQTVTPQVPHIYACTRWRIYFHFCFLRFSHFLHHRTPSSVDFISATLT